MGKRGNQAASKNNKKAKVDPVLASISTVINGSDHLPEKCRSMLVDMLPFSLSIPTDLRHESQSWAVNAVSQTLEKKKEQLEAELAAEEEKLTSLKAGEGELEATEKAAAEALQTAEDAMGQAAESLNAASGASKQAATSLATGEAAVEASKAALAVAEEDKANLSSAFEKEFAAPMQEGNGPNFSQLKPFLSQLSMEASLTNALPSSCGKSKAERGSFDEVVLEQFEKALQTRLASLAETIAKDTAGLSEKEATVVEAKKLVAETQAAEAEASKALDEATKEQTTRKEASVAAKDAITNFQPQVDAVTAAIERAKQALADFQEGPFQNFASLKSRASVQDAGAAGA